MAKLTLSVDDKVIARAKRYASDHDTSVSKMVEVYLDSVSKSARKKAVPSRVVPPHIASLIGIIKSADPEDYGRYLIEKYR